MSLDFNVAFTGLLIHCDSACARACWNRDICYAGERQRFQKSQCLREVAETFTVTNPRPTRTEGVRANRSGASAADLDAKTNRDNCFMRGVLQQLIFAGQLQIAEPICCGSVMWVQHSQSLADFNPELRRNAFGD